MIGNSATKKCALENVWLNRILDTTHITLKVLLIITNYED